jgi:hypothetical protein
MDRIGKHAEAEPRSQSRGFPRGRFWYHRPAYGLIKDR